MDINAIGNSKINENYHKNSVDNSLKNNIHDQISIFNNDSNSNFYVSNVVEYVNDEDKNADINEIYCKIDIADQQVENKRMQIKSILDGTFSNEELNQEQRIYNRWYDALLLALDEEAENIPDDKIEEYEELQDALLQNIENTNIVNTLISDVMDIKDEIALDLKDIDNEKLKLKKVELRYSSMPQDRNEDREQFPKDSTMREQIKLSRKDVKKDKSNLISTIDGLETKLKDNKEVLNGEIEKLNNAKANYNPEALAKERAEIIEKLNAFMSEDNTKIAMFAVNRHISTLNDIKENLLTGMLEDLSAREENAEQNRIEFDEYEFDYDSHKEQLFKERLFERLNDENPTSVFKSRIDFIVDIANKYNIEPELLAAVMCNESKWGNDPDCVAANRYGGVKNEKGDFKKFDTVEEGIEAVAKNLASYVERYDSVDEISIYELKDIGEIWDPGSEDWLHDTEEIYCSLRWG